MQLTPKEYERWATRYHEMRRSRLIIEHGLYEKPKGAKRLLGVMINPILIRMAKVLERKHLNVLDENGEAYVDALIDHIREKKS